MPGSPHAISDSATSTDELPLSRCGRRSAQITLPQRRLVGRARIGGTELPVCHAAFSGHESFPLRFAWLKKGYDGLRRDAAFFSSDDAMVVMGTGKNMVRSIRHWGLVCQMWDEVAGTRAQDLQPLELGAWLLADDGWDPYLEDEGTAWLLHWLAVTNGFRATTWAWMFSRQKGGPFAKSDVLAELDLKASQFGIKRSTNSSLKRDLDVFVNSYMRASSRKADLSEDALDCPFRQLGLLRPGPEKGTYELLVGGQSALPDGIFIAGLIDYITGVRQSDGPAISFEELMYGALSPGRVFRLTEESLVRRLTHAVEALPEHLAFNDTAGIRQLLLRTALPTVESALKAHYRGGGR